MYYILFVIYVIYVRLGRIMFVGKMLLLLSTFIGKCAVSSECRYFVEMHLQYKPNSKSYEYGHYIAILQ